MDSVTYCILIQFAVVSLTTPTRSVPIIKYENEGVNPDGSYRWSYETANGIIAKEQAQLKGPGLIRVEGSYQFISPEGVPVSVTYVADENGFQPQGDAIPQAIQKALAYIASHPSQEDGSGSRIPGPPRPVFPTPTYPTPLPHRPPAATVPPPAISKNAATSILKGG